MRNSNNKPRCEKLSLSKCPGVCRTYSDLQLAYAKLLRHDDRIIRVLVVDGSMLIIDCLKRTMPQWIPAEELLEWAPCNETALALP